MKPMVINTLYATSRHLTLEDRKIENLSAIACETNAFCVDGSDELIHITLISGNEVPPESTSIPLELRKLIEFMDSHEIHDALLSEDYDELPCLDIYEDDYVFSFSVYARLDITLPADETHGEISYTETCELNLEPHVMIDHRIFEEFREVCVKYALQKLGAKSVTVTFIEKAAYEELNKKNNNVTKCRVNFDENGYTVNEPDNDTEKKGD